MVPLETGFIHNGTVWRNHLTGYVEQFDTLIGELTVDQMLMYTAEMKLPRSTSREDKRKRVDQVISQLRLNKCQHTVIGNVLSRGISGGQAKRVNVALALISQPMVVFLDEPTSGLDSKMANEVCSILTLRLTSSGMWKELVKDGYTIIATVHSPTSFAFSLFDDLMMLQAGGGMVYAGPVAEVKPYFVSCGFPFPEEWRIMWLTEDVREPSNSPPIRNVQHRSSVLYGFFSADLLKAPERSFNMARNDTRNSSLDPCHDAGAEDPPDPIFRGTHYRSGEFLGPRFGDKIFMSLLSLSLYWGIGSKTDAQSIQSTAAVLYFFCALCGYGAAAFVPSLTLERALFYRERADGLYTGLTYYLAKFIEEACLTTLVCVVTSLVFSCAVFWAMELQGSFLVFAASYFLTTMVGIVLAYAVAAVAPNMEAANALLPTYVTTCLYFGGLFIVLLDLLPAVQLGHADVEPVQRSAHWRCPSLLPRWSNGHCFGVLRLQ
eukprot:g29810.t1